MTDPDSAPRARRRWPRRIVILFGLVALWVLGRPVIFLGMVAWKDTKVEIATRAGYVDDMSGMESTAVAEVWAIPDEIEPAIDGLRALLKRARSEGLGISIAGARHSQGGHTIAADGIVVDMTGFASMEFDESSELLTVGSGAVWSAVLAYLDPLGRSVAIMQSNDSFTVGGSVSVNCHGWQHGCPPIASSVRSFRILLADGRLLTCSREQNQELFSLALGGYGLFGILIDVRLEVARNELYRVDTGVLSTEEFGPAFLAEMGDPDVGLALGRVSIRPDALFEESILKVLRRVPAPGGLPPISPSGKRGLRRTVLRGSVGSDYGKDLRWTLETTLGAHSKSAQTTRNAELAESVDVYANHDPAGVDILHEYFIPHSRLSEFLTLSRPLFESSTCDLLNLTVRDVRQDHDTMLRYADQDMFGFVMLFHQRLTPAGEEAMGELTRELIDLADGLGGRYYLPYRPHATRAQFERAYPMAKEFFEAKLRFDPDELFTNRFYDRYGPRGQ